MPGKRDSIQRDIEVFQHELDKVFKRPNEDPVFDTRKKLEDAISDNPRFYPPDRRADLAEIFFAILDFVYERAGCDNDPDPFCNPVLPGACLDRLPEPEMLFRCMMPLPWAIKAAWAFPDMKYIADDFTSSFTQTQAKLIYEILDFLLDLFPESQPGVMSADVRDYWHELSETPEAFHKESDEEKSRMLPLLLEAAKKHNLIGGER